MPAFVVLALVRRWREARVPFALAVLAILWSAGLAGVLADPFGPLRSITAHQAVRALPLLALALAALAGLAFGRPGSRPSPWLAAALALILALVLRPDVLLHKNWLLPGAAMLAVLPAAHAARRRCRAGLRARPGGARRRSRLARLLPAQPAPAGRQLGSRRGGVPERARDRALPAGAPRRGGPDALRDAGQGLHAPQATALRAQSGVQRPAARHGGDALRAGGRVGLRPAATARLSRRDRRLERQSAVGSPLPLGRGRADEDAAAPRACATTSPTAPTCRAS